ncbi:hypothetical protein K449DRAFT_468968 [Hypoxylon sp. EC38]|nr:hypothetical protein K449DRAFT_468968 [Hypoxylon sp. EC38]
MANMLLKGMRLVRVLDLIDRHHKLLRRLFNIEYDPLTRLSEPAKELCNKLRDLVSPYVEVLFVTIPGFEDKIKQRVWSGIYKRIGSPSSSPYRFKHISYHRHVRLDDHVRRHLSKRVREALPTNFEETDYGLPHYLQRGACDRFPHAVQPTTDVILRGEHAKDGLFYSPTAEIMAGPAKPVSETYYCPRRGFLQRPLRIKRSAGQSQGSSSAGTYSNYSNSTANDYNFNDSDGTDSDDDSDSDIDEDDPSSLQKSHCSLCSTVRRINRFVASARIDATRDAYPSSYLRKVLERAGKEFEKDWSKIQATESSRVPRNHRIDPDDERFWNGLVKTLLNYLMECEREAQRARVVVLGMDPRPGEEVVIYEDEESDEGSGSGSDSDNEDYGGSNKENLNEDNENGHVLRELTWFLNRLDVEDESTDEDLFVGPTTTSPTMTTPEPGYGLPPFNINGRPLVLLR